MRAPETARTLEVPFHSQRRDHCGPAALAMALNWAGDPVTPQQLDATAFTEGREGSLELDVLSAARRRGSLAYPVRDLASLFDELDAGHPVLVLQNLGYRWLPVWHFSVAVGYALSTRSLIQHTGRYEARPVSLYTFERTWDRAERWGLVVLPAGTLPATAREAPYLDAVLGLENAGRPVEAALAYRAATRRWPDSLGAWMGLGNALYASGDPGAARPAYERATRLDPAAAVAFNNLAQVLLELGRREAARAAVERAIELGGPHLESFERTRAAIESTAP